MALQGLGKIIIMMTLVGAAILFMTLFGIQLAIDNNSPNNIANDPTIQNYRQNVSTVLTLYQFNGSQTGISAFSTQDPTTGTDNPQISATAKIWSVYANSPYTALKLVFGTIQDTLFGGPNGGFSLIFTIIGSLCAIIITLYAWQWIRIGTP